MLFIQFTQLFNRPTILPNVLGRDARLKVMCTCREVHRLQNNKATPILKWSEISSLHPQMLRFSKLHEYMASYTLRSHCRGAVPHMSFRCSDTTITLLRFLGNEHIVLPLLTNNQ